MVVGQPPRRLVGVRGLAAASFTACLLSNVGCNVSIKYITLHACRNRSIPQLWELGCWTGTFAIGQSWHCVAGEFG